MKKVLLITLLFCVQVSFAQGWIPAGARSMSMANASVTNDDVWGYFNNPGVLGELEGVSVGLSYENRFLLRELQSQGLAIAIPLKVGVLSVGGHQYGYKRYRSYKGGLGYSLKLTDKLFAGVQMNYQGLILPESYGSKSSLTGEAGISAFITDNWRIGVSAFNVGRAKLSEFEDDRFSTMLRLGTSYRFSDKFFVSAEAEKDLDYSMRFKAGFEYEIVKAFYFRGGVATSPVEITAGFGYGFKKLQVDIGTAYHQILGWSPQISFQYKAK